MKKLLQKLQIPEIGNILNIQQAKGVYGGIASLSYDNSANYDGSLSYDTCSDGDIPSSERDF